MASSPPQLARQPATRPAPSAGVPIVTTDSYPTRRPVLTRRSLRYALGFLWVLDGLLQLQPFMFTTGFAHQIIAPAAAGQPSFVAAPVRWNAALIGMHPAVFNGSFAGIQLALGVGLFLPRLCRPALIASILWAGAVWYAGEGLGGLAGGHVSGLLGAPGAALLYGVLALAAWPGRQHRASDSPTPPIYPAQWILRAWAALWIGLAALNLLPGNGSSSAIGSELTSSASTVSPWLADLDRVAASAVHGMGNGAGVLFIVLPLSIGLLALGRGRLRQAAIWTGIALALLYWAGGQSFGQLFNGRATDPSTGPLVVLMGLACLGVAIPNPSTRRGGIRSMGKMTYGQVVLD